MPDRPNLLVVMSDQHTPDVLGACGDPHVHTPHLDRLAAEGTLFRNAYCNSPICVPSRMSFLSGMTPGAIEVWSLSDAMRSDLATWPVVLGAAGYDTVMSGRMHMWYPDKGLGFHRRLCGDPHTRLSVGTFELYEEGPERERQCAAFKSIFFQELRKSANRRSGAVHPSPESWMRVAQGAGKNGLHEVRVDFFSRTTGCIIAILKLLDCFHTVGIPSRSVPCTCHPVQHVIDGLMKYGSHGLPVLWVE